MRTFTGRNLTSLLLVLAISVLTISGCGNTSGAPTIPPIETFLIPFETLTANATSTFASLGEQEVLLLASNRSNWNYAAFTVGFWYTVIAVGLAVPVAAFRESFRHSPVQQPDG